MPTASERRRIQRVNLDAPMAGRISASTIVLIDISATGARIEHRAPLTHGRHVELEISCDGERVTVECDVTRCKIEKGNEGIVYRSGLRFSDPTSASVAAIRRLIAGLVMRDLEARKQHMIPIKK